MCIVVRRYLVLCSSNWCEHCEEQEGSQDRPGQLYLYATNILRLSQVSRYHKDFIKYHKDSIKYHKDSIKYRKDSARQGIV